MIMIRFAFWQRGSDGGYSTDSAEMKAFEQRYPDDFFRKNVNQWQVLIKGKGEGENKVQLLAPKCMVQGVDFATLKVVTPNILIDKNNIYNGNYEGIGVIPIKALKLDVQIFTEDDFSFL